MTATKRRIPNIIDEIEHFVWTGSPHQSPPALLSSICRLIALTERLRVAAAMLPPPRLQSLLDSMNREVDGTPVREVGALLPQLALARGVEASAQRKYF
jgi:hypothetical protein